MSRQQTGATLIGIDLSRADAELASGRAALQGLDGQASFLAGDLTATGLPDASCDAVMRLDVLLFVQGKAAAIREVAHPAARRPVRLHHLGTARTPGRKWPGTRGARRRKRGIVCLPPVPSRASMPFGMDRAVREGGGADGTATGFGGGVGS